MQNDRFDARMDVGDYTVSSDSFPITPNNTQNLPRPVRAIRVTNGGTLKCDTFGGDGRILNFLDGETRFVAIKKVYSDGTTCAGIEGMP